MLTRLKKLVGLRTGIGHSARTAGAPLNGWAPVASFETLESRRLMSGVTSFTLVNAATDRDIAPLADGAVLNLATLPSRRLNVRADVSDGVESVRFGYDAKAAYRTDSTAPYALGGNKGRNYYAWTPTLGTHTVVATPYARDRAAGAPGTARTIRFTVVDQPPAAAPSALTAAPLAAPASGVTLSWKDNATNEDGFFVERAVDGSAFSLIATVGANTASYRDEGLAPGLYTYRVRAYNAAGPSAASDDASATVPAPPPAAPLPPSPDAPAPEPAPTPEPAPAPAPEPAPSPEPTPTPVPEVVYSAPIVITRGGVYTGNWQSLDPAVAAVTIKTEEPVVIENANVRGRGTLIETVVQHAHVTVRNTNGYGMNPDVYGLTPGRFFEGTYFDSVLLQDNYMEGTGGIKLLEYRGDYTAAETIRVIGNQALNIDGRRSDGNGGYLDFNKRTRLSDGYTEKGYKIRQFLQLDKVQNVPGIEIAWNEVVNEPGKSRVEDNINIYLSSGTATSPIDIHDNYIRGAYTIKPWQTSYSDGTWEYDWGYSGGGILLGDGSTGVAHVVARYNQVVSTSNYGIAIAAGHDLRFYGNRILSSGRLADGRWIAAQNVGAYIWDLYGVGPADFFNNSADNNLIGWVNKADGSRNDWWMPDASSFENNTRWAGSVTLQSEVDELAYWQAKLAASDAA